MNDKQLFNLQPGSVHLEAIVSINSGSSTDSKQHLIIDIVSRNKSHTI